MDTQNLNVKNFGDYRSFLKTHFEVKQKLNPSWSLGAWAKRLDLKATSSLTKILNGDRDPGESITEKFAQYFDFDSNEKNYFNDLIRLSKIKDDPRLKMILMQKMGREYPDAHLHVLTDKSFEIISNWFCMTIREMVRLYDFQEDPEWIQERLMFEVSVDEIRQAIKDLLHQGLIKRNDEGKLISSQGLLHTTNDVASKSIKRFHKQMLDHAKTSLHTVDVELREFSSETLTINKSNISQAKELIRDFKAKFARLLEEQQGDETYQLQVQFFPLTGTKN
jgi:uncharacterized protein (TIGR02147 family)